MPKSNSEFDKFISCKKQVDLLLTLGPLQNNGENHVSINYKVKLAIADNQFLMVHHSFVKKKLSDSVSYL